MFREEDFKTRMLFDTVLTKGVVSVVVEAVGPRKEC